MAKGWDRERASKFEADQKSTNRHCKRGHSYGPLTTAIGGWLNLQAPTTKPHICIELMPSKPLPSKKAQPNEKMIEVRIRFWTNDIAPTKGEISPKHSWDSGVVHMQSNTSHGIDPKNPKPFHTLMDLPAVIEKVLVAHGVQLHHGKQSLKYFHQQ